MSPQWAESETVRVPMNCTSIHRREVQLVRCARLRQRSSMLLGNSNITRPSKNQAFCHLFVILKYGMTTTRWHVCVLQEAN